MALVSSVSLTEEGFLILKLSYCTKSIIRSNERTDGKMSQNELLFINFEI